MKVKICIVNFLGEDRKIEVCLLYVLISLKYELLLSADNSDWEWQAGWFGKSGRKYEVFKDI